MKSYIYKSSRRQTCLK